MVPRCWNTLQRKRPRPGDAVGQVDFLRVLELLALRGGHDRRGHLDEVLVIELLLVGDRREVPVDAGHRVAADLEVQVGGALFDGELQQVVDVHAVLHAEPDLRS